jgi:hypothetical protein
VTLSIPLLALLALTISQASTVLDVTFSHLTVGGTIGDGDRIEDVSGNGYHGFWGDASGSYSVVATPNGVGIDTTTSARGHVFHRDGLTGIPSGWDGPTTTVSPYFTLDAGSTGSFTFEAVVNWNNTTSTRNGLMGQTGAGSQAWLREDGGYIQYAFGVEAGANANLFSNTIDISTAKSDEEWHGIAVVYDGPAGEIRTYLDGSLLHTNTDSDIGSLGTLLVGTTDFRTGAYNTTDGNQFQGLQDRYRISNTALTPTEFLPIPEPSALALVSLGALGFMRRRR